MWNINFRRGTIWKIKDANEYDYSYQGMTFGSYYVLFLSTYIDEFDRQKFTYLIIHNNIYKNDFKYYIDINNNRYVEMDRLLTGDIRSLEKCVGEIDNYTMKTILESLKIQFNIFRKEKAVKEEFKPEPEIKQQKIYKFGIDIYVTENEDVHITEKKKLILSQKAKDDIVYNSKTENDIRILCDKYMIYPIKAMREIRNRLVYQHKQNKG